MEDTNRIGQEDYEPVEMDRLDASNLPVPEAPPE